MLLEGLHIPLTTPFFPDGRLNPRKLAANVARYSKTPAAGLIVLGPSGEPTLLSDDETREALRTAADAAAPEKVLIAGISRDSVRSTLDLAEFAAAQDFDAILVGIPSIFAAEKGRAPAEDPPQSPDRLRELLAYFLTVADRSPLPVILLSVPGRALPIDAIMQLAASRNVIALLTALSRAADFNSFERFVQLTIAPTREVDVTPVFAAVTARMKRMAAGQADAGLTDTRLISAASLEGAATLVAGPPHLPAPLRARTKSVGFQIIAGTTESMLDDLRAGAAGVASSFAACAPQACYEVFAAWKDNDQPLAEEKQARLFEAAHLAEDSPGNLKYTCDLNGYFGGTPRPPLLPPSGEQRSALEALMKDIRN